MISKRAIIRMLLDGHQLKAIVAIGYNPRKHIQAKLIICAHLFGVLTHADMAFVDEKRVLVGAKTFFLELIGLGRVPYLS
jgi:hypothetical protein